MMRTDIFIESLVWRNDYAGRGCAQLVATGQNRNDPIWKEGNVLGFS